MSRSLGLLLAAAAVALIDHAPARAERIARHTGPISSVAVARIEEAFASGGATALVITSQGGDARAGIKLGQFVQSHRVSVTAEGYCLSSCASYVLLASPAPRVAPGTVVGFHDTMTSMLTAARAKDPAFAQRTYGALAKEEASLYQALAIDPSLLVLPAAKMHPVCAFIDHSRGASAALAIVASTYTLYVPSQATLKRLGVHIEGEIADTEPEIAAAFHQSAFKGATMKVRADLPGAQLPTQAQLVAALTDVPVCSAAVQAYALRVYAPPPQ